MESALDKMYNIKNDMVELVDQLEPKSKQHGDAVEILLSIIATINMLES